MNIYLFGYGSLLSEQSRNSTCPLDDHPIPVTLHHFERGWFLEDPIRKHTALCVREKQNSRTNGILIKIGSGVLEKFDRRETGYKRIKLTKKNFVSYSIDIPDDAQIYLYVPEEINLKQQNYPITQTYLDIALKGALEVGESFAKDFISFTRGWEKEIINDRENPVWKREYSMNVYAKELDEFIDEMLPEIINKRKKV